MLRRQKHLNVEIVAPKEEEVLKERVFYYQRYA
jgi:hypothetical protein